MFASAFRHGGLFRGLAPHPGLRPELLQSCVLLSLFLLTCRFGEEAQSGFKLIRAVDWDAVFAIVAVILPAHGAIAGARWIAAHSDGDHPRQGNAKVKSPVRRREPQILVVKLLDGIPALSRFIDPLRCFGLVARDFLVSSAGRTRTFRSNLCGEARRKNQRHAQHCRRDRQVSFFVTHVGSFSVPADRFSIQAYKSSLAQYHKKAAASIPFVTFLSNLASSFSRKRQSPTVILPTLFPDPILKARCTERRALWTENQSSPKRLQALLMAEAYQVLVRPAL